MPVSYRLKVFGYRIQHPAPHEGDSWLDYRPDILSKINKMGLTSVAFLQRKNVLNTLGDYLGCGHILVTMRGSGATSCPSGGIG